MVMDFTIPLGKGSKEAYELTGNMQHPGPFDMEIIKRSFAPYHAEIKKMEAQAEAHEVTTAETEKQAVAMAGEAKRLGKKIKAAVEETVNEPNQFVKSVRSFGKDFTEALDRIERGLKDKIGPYAHKAELERREQERKAQEAARALQKKIDAEAKKMGVESVTVVTPVIPKDKGVVRSETGTSSHIRKAWKAEVVDESQVPREFCSPDMRLVNQAVKMGVREIPGVRIFEDIQTVLRT